MPSSSSAPAAIPAVHSELLAWYATHQRDLPWRQPGTTPWAVLLSEVMSQQTPVSRLIPTWERWLSLWPHPIDLAKAPKAQIIREWGTLGYPRRALWLQEAAQVICEKFDGEVPTNYDDLVSLPGIGDYTASAICAFAFNQSIPVLDTNVRRVYARVFDGEQRPRTSSPTKAERQLAQELLPANNAATWAVAVMEFGSLTCKATTPQCEACVITEHCRWRERGFPESKTQPKRQTFEGTDRQVRGLILRLLRESDSPVTGKQLETVWSDDIQRLRCLDTLIADGLVQPLAKEAFQLPDFAT